MKTLVIAEKPSVARDIARVLGCSKKENGALEGNKYIVTWALGHLVTLKDPEDYDKKYKEWNMAVLPMMPEKLQIKVIPQTGNGSAVEIVVPFRILQIGKTLTDRLVRHRGNPETLTRLLVMCFVENPPRHQLTHTRISATDRPAYGPLHQE